MKNIFYKKGYTFLFLGFIGSLLLIPTIIFAHTYQGELEVIVVDNFNKNKATIIYQLHEADKIYRLKLPEGYPTKGLLTGRKILVEGQERLYGLSADTENSVINVNSIDVINKPEETSHFEPNAVSGKRNIVILLVNFTNLKATNTVSLSNADSFLFTGAKSTNKNYLKSSYDQVFFNRDSNSDTKPDIYTIDLNYAVTDCNFNKWAMDAKQAAIGKGINLNLYKHFMFIIPKGLPQISNSFCASAEGWADLGCITTCSTWIKAANISEPFAQLVYTHELGHNLGLYHARTDLDNNGILDSGINGEYGDYSCFMGNGVNAFFLPSANAPHRDKMGWFAKYPTLIKAIVPSGDYNLYPLELPTSNTQLRVLKIKKNSSANYYVSYRIKSSPFQVGPAQLNKVSIHWAPSNPSDSNTYYITSISTGERFKVPGLTIKAISTGGSYAKVKVVKY